MLDDLQGLLWRPRFDYVDCDVPVFFELEIPQADWDYESMAEGGNDEATSGEQESFVIRHDRCYTMHLRITERQWVEDFEPMLRTLWGQAQAFTVRLDANDAATEHEVYLVEPWMSAKPSKNKSPGVLELDMKVRTSDGSIFTYPYFPDVDDLES